MKYTISLKIDPTTELPVKSGMYSVGIQNHSTLQTQIRKLYFDAKSGNFRLNNGRKNDKVVYWFKNIFVPGSIFDNFNQLKSGETYEISNN